MSETLDKMKDELELCEQELDHAYIEYAKIVEEVTSTQMRSINGYVDKIIQLKRKIKEEEGRN